MERYFNALSLSKLYSVEPTSGNVIVAVPSFPVQVSEVTVTVISDKSGPQFNSEFGTNIS